MKFPRYCKWCLICLLPVLILGVPLFIKQGFSLITIMILLPALACPIVMGIIMGKMCEDQGVNQKCENQIDNQKKLKIVNEEKKTVLPEP